MDKKSLLILGLMVSCAQMDKTPKTVHFPYASELLTSIQNSNLRSPAAEVDLKAEEEKSPRRVYFGSLYHQFLTLGEFLGKDSHIEFCPQFHHDKIETEAYRVPKVSVTKPSQISDDGKEYFPELAFDKKFSLKDYHSSVREELEILCEEGVSDNYYKFDNLVTNYANKKSFHHNPKSMESVLKIPVFANFYLLKMLQGPAQDIHPEEKRIIELTHTEWFQQYISEAGRKRNNFIKNKLVQR